ncbi:putative gustatory receptor 28b [Prorops nasuta]|uniref:putative gustatory receptor 28b n=1 Tax=Prorops nasuta TaxID=863751 RepID=UPI0034CF6964
MLLNDCLAPLERTCAIFGLRAPKCGNKWITVSFSLIYSILASLGYITILYFGYDRYLRVKSLSLEKALVSFVTYAYVPTVVSLSILGLRDTQPYRKHLERLDKLDKTLETMNIQMSDKNKQAYRMIIIAVTGWFLFITLLNLLSTFILHRESDMLSIVFIGVMHAYPQSLSYLVLLEFSISAICLEWRFRKINELLRNTSVEGEAFVWNYARLEEYLSNRRVEHHKLDNRKRNRIYWTRARHLLQISRQVHLELCKTSRKISKSFGLQILVITVSYIILLTFLFYNLYVKLNTPNATILSKIKKTLFTLFLFISYLGQLLFVNRACDSTGREAMITAEVVHRINSNVARPEIREEIYQFGLQLLQNPLNFSAMGFFSLNNNSLRTIAGVISTYSVILIQISNFIESKKKKIHDFRM